MIKQTSFGESVGSYLVGVLVHFLGLTLVSVDS